MHCLMNPAITTPERSLWPAAIICWFVIFIGGIIAFVIFAQRNRMELVGADYYDQEIRFQQQIDRVSRTRPFNREVSVNYDAGSRQITVALPPEQARRKPSGVIRFYRPSDSSLDRTVNLAVGDNGRQILDASELRDGLWKVRLTWAVGGEEFAADDSIVVSTPRSAQPARR